MLHEINELNQVRQGIIEMVADVRIPSLFLPPCFVKQDICSAIHNNSLSKALIYFPPKYSIDNKGRDEIYADLRRAALVGGDCIMLWGRGTGKNQVMYIRCQCSVLYCGSKVDKATGFIIDRSDYRKSTYSNDRKNQRHGQEGRNASHRTASERRLTKTEDRCSFTLAVYRDDQGYYLNSLRSHGSHQFHPRRDHLRHPTSLLI